MVHGDLLLRKLLYYMKSNKDKWEIVTDFCKVKHLFVITFNNGMKYGVVLTERVILQSVWGQKTISGNIVAYEINDKKLHTIQIFEPDIHRDYEDFSKYLESRIGFLKIANQRRALVKDEEAVDRLYELLVGARND